MSVAAAPRLAPVPRMLWKQTVAGFIGLMRIPAFSATGLILPVVFFIFFGLSQARESFNGVSVGAYLMASFGAYAVSNMMVFNFGIAVAQERATKSDLLLRASPLPPIVYLASKVIVAAAFGMLALAILFVFAELAGGVRLSAPTIASLFVRLLLGSLPFIGLGFAIGYGTSASAAPAVTNLIYLPLSFASGLFVPVSALPSFIQQIAPFLPTYHYGQLAWNAIGASSQPLGKSVIGLGIWTLILLFLALRAYRRDERRKFA